MRPTATDVARSVVRLFVCMLVINGKNEMPFGDADSGGLK